jgi:hypothetical protein
MWIHHNGNLYNLDNVISIFKYDKNNKPEIKLYTIHDIICKLDFNNITERDEYFHNIQRLVFNLDSSV